MIRINIQYTPKMMAQIVRETLTALCKDIYQGIVRLGCGIAGLPYENDSTRR